MGPLGVPEMIFIFVLALLLFGPKKLPELGKTLGKAMAEFQRAKNDLKSTFDREMRNLERENESLKEVTNSYYHDSYNYDYSSHDSGAYGSEYHDSTATTNPQITGASATQGAELTPAEPPAGSIANGTVHTASIEEHPAVSDYRHSEHAENGHSAEQTTLKS